MKITNDGFEMEQQMMVQAKKVGLKMIEVEYHDPGRLGNESKVSAIRQGFVNLILIIRERFCHR